MKLAFLAAASSIHTVKWVNEMVVRGHEVHLITMHSPKEKISEQVHFHRLPYKPNIGYYLNFPVLKNLLRQIKPDILNAHYASGYGTLARLSDFHPTLLSVWGSDVYDFPYKSKIKMNILQKNLAFADRIASTSKVMKKQTESICKCKSEIDVTPFGVDCEKFKPMKVNRDKSQIRIGTIKKMASKYGIATLIKAFAIVKSKFHGDVILILVGGGPEEEELKCLAQKLNISKYVDFVGRIPHRTVPEYLNSFDIYVALSILDSESFGVAIVEASACELPVVVSDAGGLPEVVADGQTGFVVSRDNPVEAADRILQLLNNPKLRMEMGKAGRQFVLDNYEWKENADRMKRIYEKLVKHNISTHTR